MSRVPQSTAPLGVAWPVAGTAAYGPTSASLVGPDHILEGPLPYKRASGYVSDPGLAGKKRVIIPHNGKSFVAPPQ